MRRPSETAPETASLDEGGAPPLRVGVGTFQALLYRDFRYLWLGQIFHALGLWVEMVALPLLVLDIPGGSAVDLGLVMAARTIPAVALGLLAGVLADTFNRRALLLMAKAAAMVIQFVFAASILLGLVEMWQVYTFAILRGSAMAFDQPARRAIVPSIVPENLVTNAMALSMGSVQVTRIAGAAVAGILVATIGMGPTFMVSAVLKGVALLSTALVRVPDYQRAGYQGPKVMVTDLVEGFKFAWNAPTIRGVLLVGLGYFTFGASFMQIFAPLFAKEVLEIGDQGYGYMMAMTGVGGILGALALAKANPNRRRGLILVGAMALFGVVLILFSLSTYLALLFLVFPVAALLGFGQAPIFSLLNAVLLTAAPLHMRGRIIGLLSLDRAMISLGSVFAGFLAALAGPQVAQIIFGVACVITALGMVSLYAPIRHID